MNNIVLIIIFTIIVFLIVRKLLTPKPAVDKYLDEERKAVKDSIKEIDQNIKNIKEIRDKKAKENLTPEERAKKWDE